LPVRPIEDGCKRFTQSRDFGSLDWFGVSVAIEQGLLSIDGGNGLIEITIAQLTILELYGE